MIEKRVNRHFCRVNDCTNYHREHCDEDVNNFSLFCFEVNVELECKNHDNESVGGVNLYVKEIEVVE